jgi:hypothetical protein
MRSMGTMLSVVALAAAGAFADIDVETAAAIKAKSTLAPEGELETFRFDATAGTRLSFSLAAGRGAELQFAPVLTAPDASVVELDNFLKVKPKGIAVTNLPLEQSGTYVLIVTGSGTGDYTLALTGSPQTRFTAIGQLDPANPQPSAFSAPPGSSVALSVKAAKGSAATPRFGMLTGDGYALDLVGMGRLTETSQSVTVQEIGGTGDFVVVVGNDGAIGDVVLSISVKPPRRKQAKLDLRAKSLGRPSGGETFVARAIGPEGGLVDVTNLESELLGASVSVPPGALASTLPVSIASAVTPVPPDRDDQAAGPAIDLRPSGTVFLSAVTVTLPFDISLLPANADPEDIRVLVIEDDGSTRVIVPFAVDVVAGTVSVLTSSFSVCVPIVRSGPPRLGLTPGGDEYWLFVQTFDLEPSQDADSRVREYFLEVSEASFFDDGTAQASTEERYFRVENPDGPTDGVEGNVNSSAANSEFNGTWAYGVDGRSIQITGGTAPPLLWISRDGSVMAGRGRPSDWATGQLYVLLRKNTSPITVASLAGTYSISGFELSADQDGFGTPAKAEPTTLTGTVTFDGEGGLKATVSERNTEFDGGAGVWRDSVGGGGLTATYSVEASGTVLFEIPPDDGDDTGDTLRLFPGPSANSFIATDRDPQNGNHFVLFLVRQGSGLSRESLDGAYRLEDVSVAPQTYQSTGPSPVTVPDLWVADESAALAFDGSAQLVSFDGAFHEVQRDPSEIEGLFVSNAGESLDVAVAVGSKGNFTLTETSSGGTYTGGLAPDAMFGFFVSGIRNDPAHSHTIGVLLRLPPGP